VDRAEEQTRPRLTPYRQPLLPYCLCIDEGTAALVVRTYTGHELHVVRIYSDTNEVFGLMNGLVYIIFSLLAIFIWFVKLNELIITTLFLIVN
jgi:hypothetical protein